MNYDWPHGDAFWRTTLETQNRVRFAEVEPSLCALVEKVAGNAATGIVVFEGDSLAKPFGDGYTAAIALTMAGQRGYLPVAAASLAKHKCLEGLLSVKEDLRTQLIGKSRLEAWEWAIETLLPHSSNSTVFNLNHYRVKADPLGFRTDQQSPATASSIDYIVQQNAFVMDLESHDASSTGCSGKPCRDTAPWGRTMR